MRSVKCPKSRYLPLWASQLLTLELDILETSLFTDLARNRQVEEKDGILDWESSSQDSNEDDEDSASSFEEEKLKDG